MTASDHIRLTVLPFENLSLKEDLGIFCRSFSIDLITELSRFRQFQLISGTAPNEGSATNGFDTDYLIQGTFRCEQETVRLNVQLVRADTRSLVWANRFEGALLRVTDLQEKLLLEVVGVLQGQINQDLLSKTRKKQQVSPKAYEYWLYGMEELKKGSIESDLKAREHFEHALQIQPDYSLAHSGISLSYFNEWSCQMWERWDVSQGSANEWAQKAIELDDQNHVAAHVLGKIFMYEGSYETAEYYLRKSLLLNPNDPDTLINIAAYFTFIGLHDEAVQLYKRAVALNPIDDSYHAIGAIIYFERGEFEKASSLIINAPAVPWADSEAYNAAIFFHTGDHTRMRTHWELFLKNFRRLISKGKDFTQQEAVDWVRAINPHRKGTNLDAFFTHLGSGPSPSKQQPLKRQDKVDALNAFVKENSMWRLSYKEEEVKLPEVKGFFDIQRLVSAPREAHHCLDLMGGVLVATGEKVFDASARNQYQRRILELQAEIQEAEHSSNYEQLEKLQLEYDQLLDHLSQSLGLKGRIREAGNPVEKARSAVTWRIRNAIARIEREHPMLGAHLSNAIKTGTFCSYQPENAVEWVTG